MNLIQSPYREFENIRELPYQFVLGDHLHGFDQDLSNPLLSKLQHHAQSNDLQYKITFYQIVTPQLKAKYPNLTLLSDFQKHDYHILRYFRDYNVHPEISYDHFVCSFNGMPHISRKLLVSILDRFGWFSPDTCSKNFSYTKDILDGHLRDLLDDDQHRINRKFFVGDASQVFFEKTYSFGHVQYEHAKNIYNLENKLTRSFLHVVSESLATSFYPFVTEKFLYSVVTRGLFLAYAQPGWHDWLQRYYGFKMYNKLFDYSFDAVLNPVERLVNLMSMLHKFSVLSADDWCDLYQMEADTVEYNYDWYFSKGYLGRLEALTQ